VVASANLISAGAGLAGAMIGGVSTYLANRIQWRRESRRTAYAALISSSYDVENFIMAGLKNSEAKGVDADTSSDDPRTEFYSRLDSAVLLAKWKTQNALHKWRDLYVRLDGFDDLTRSQRTSLREVWQERRSEFYDRARDELGVAGRYSYGRALTAYIFVVILVILISCGLRSMEHGDTAVGVVRWTLLLITTALLILTLRAALRWRFAAAHVQGAVTFERVISTREGRRDFLRLVDPVQIAIVIAFIFVFVTMANEKHDISVIFGGIGAFILVMGGIFQLMTAGDPLHKAFHR
jgi:hypothetical protein